MAQFVIGNDASCKLFVESEAPKYFILRQFEAQANLKKLFAKTTLFSPRVFAHQKRSPNRQKFFVVDLILAAIAATLPIKYRVTRSVQP